MEAEAVQTEHGVSQADGASVLMLPQSGRTTSPW